MSLPRGYFIGELPCAARTEEDVAAAVAAELAKGGWVQIPGQPVYDPEREDRCQPCAPSCELVFDRLVVSYLMRGGTRVMWELQPTFTDDGPYIFQLQVSESANPNASDWEDVGAPVGNTYYAIDGEQRSFGKMNRAFYRVKLYTGTATYYSEPTGAMGTLSRRDWRIAKEVIRQELVRMRLAAGQEGLLLKRHISGEPCTECIDPLTGEVRNNDCEFCYGTGVRCGYFYPMDCIWAEIDPKTYHVEQSGARGTVNDIVVKARMVNTWMLGEEDIWVNRLTDERYYIHRVQNVAEMRGVPLIANVEMRPAPISSSAYDIELPQQQVS